MRACHPERYAGQYAAVRTVRKHRTVRKAYNGKTVQSVQTALFLFLLNTDQNRSGLKKNAGQNQFRPKKALICPSRIKTMIGGTT